MEHWLAVRLHLKVYFKRKYFTKGTSTPMQLQLEISFTDCKLTGNTNKQSNAENKSANKRLGGKMILG